MFEQIGCSKILKRLSFTVSGLIAQPLIGAISDASLSKYRRRYWIVSSAIVLIVAGLLLAFVEPIGRFVVQLFKGSVAEVDHKRAKLVRTTPIVVDRQRLICAHCRNKIRLLVSQSSHFMRSTLP